MIETTASTIGTDLRDRRPSPVRVTIEGRRSSFRLDLASLVQYRELLYFLVWRDVKVRYKQTAIGAGWAVLQPLFTMAIVTVIFGKFAKMPSDGLPYPLFALAGLLPWMYFAGALGRSSNSLVAYASVITKVYFPRLIVPLSAGLAPALDLAVSFLLLVGLMAWYGVAPTAALLTLPLFVVLAVAAALAVGLWLAPLNARYRDVGHTVPFLTQVWMYASPVVYPVSLVPDTWRLLYGLNPMAGVIEGFRWAVLGTPNPDFRVIAVGAAVVLVLLLGGLAYFQRMERGLADLV